MVIRDELFKFFDDDLKNVLLLILVFLFSVIFWIWFESVVVLDKVGDCEFDIGNGIIYLI